MTEDSERLLEIFKAAMFTESHRVRMTTTAEIASVFGTLFKKYPGSTFAREIMEAFGPILTKQRTAFDDAFELFAVTANKYGYIPGPKGDVSLESILSKHGKN